jgi:Mrp family chromosome partitioning ATPase
MAADYVPAGPVAPANEGGWTAYLQAIGAHRLLVAACTLAALLGCLAWLAQRTDQYETTAEILVTPLPQGDVTFQGLPFLRDYGDATRTIQTAATLVESPAASALTARRLKDGWTADGVAQSIEVSPQGESSVLAVSAKADSGRRAASLANTFADAALDVRTEALRVAVVAALDRLNRQQARLAEAPAQDEAAADLAQRIGTLETVRDGNDPTLSFSERAAVPGAPIGTPKWVLAILALAAGFALGSGVALMLELVDRRVRGEDELLQILPVPVLARAPIMPRRARRGVLSPAQMPPGVREAFRTLRVQLERQPGTHRTIMLTSASSGDGKTTSAVNLALSLVGGGHRVVLIDFDLRKPDLARVLGLTPRHSLVATLTGTPLAELLTPAPQLPPLQVVPAASTEGDIALLESLRRKLPAILEEAQALADYVVLDTAPLGEVSDALTIADQVDDIIVVARPGHTNRANLENVPRPAGRRRPDTDRPAAGGPPRRAGHQHVPRLRRSAARPRHRPARHRAFALAAGPPRGQRHPLHRRAGPTGALGQRPAADRAARPRAAPARAPRAGLRRRARDLRRRLRQDGLVPGRALPAGARRPRAHRRAAVARRAVAVVRPRGRLLRALHAVELRLDAVGRRARRRLGGREPDAPLLARLHRGRAAAVVGPDGAGGDRARRLRGRGDRRRPARGHRDEGQPRRSAAHRPAVGAGGLRQRHGEPLAHRVLPGRPGCPDAGAGAPGARARGWRWPRCCSRPRCCRRAAAPSAGSPSPSSCSCSCTRAAGRRWPPSPCRSRSRRSAGTR